MNRSLLFLFLFLLVCAPNTVYAMPDSEYSNVDRILVDIAQASTQETKLYSIAATQEVNKAVEVARSTGRLAETFEEISFAKSIVFSESRIRISVKLKNVDTPFPKGYDIIKSGRIGGKVGVWISPSQILDLSKEPEVRAISLPSIAEPDVVSEGIDVSKAKLLHQVGIKGVKKDGTPVKVAVFDVGFNNTNPEISGNIAGSWAPAGESPWNNDTHGTAVAEIIVDMVPDVELYLVYVPSDEEFPDAIDYAISENVDVISMSLGWKSIGPFDGTDDMSKEIERAHDNGILFVKSAGNEGDRHHEGTISNPNSYYAFNPSGGDINITFTLRFDQNISATLNWDDWVDRNQDLDLYLHNDAGYEVANSTRVQDGNTEDPVEYLFFTAPVAGDYHLSIFAKNINRPVDFDLYGEPRFPEYNMPASSLTIPAASPHAIAVGAAKWQDGSLKDYSSRGPTNDGRIKPDLTAPTGVTTTVDASFGGTSAAAPHVAGLAALLIAQYSEMYGEDPSPATIKALLMGTAVDSAGNVKTTKDNEMGAGMIDAYNAYLGTGVLYPYRKNNGCTDYPEVKRSIKTPAVLPSNPALPVKGTLYWENWNGVFDLNLPGNPGNRYDTTIMASTDASATTIYDFTMKGVSGLSNCKEDTYIATTYPENFLETTGSITQGNVKEFNIDIPNPLPADKSYLRSIVYWDDANNNLDIELYDPSGSLVDSSSLQGVDAEQVGLSAPVGGTWKLKIRGTSVSGCQIFSILSNYKADLPPQDPETPGGINFTSAELNYISFCSPDEGELEFVMKAEEAGTGEPIIDIGSKTGSSLDSFLVGLSIPNGDQFLSMDPPDPYVWSAEKGVLRINPQFARTKAGLTFLDADVKLKQIFAYPEMETALEDGYQEWNRMIQGTSYYGKLTAHGWYYPSPLMRTWISPDAVTANGDECRVFITNATLNVGFAVDEVYFASSQYGLTQAEIEDIGTKLETWRVYFEDKVFETVVPVAEFKINNNPEFEDLRSVYVSLSIAQWYKTLDRNRVPFGSIIDSGNVTGLEADTPYDQAYWEDKAWDYLGDLNLNTPSGTFSISFRGGVVLGLSAPDVEAPLVSEQEALITEATTTPYANVGEDYYYSGITSPDLPDIQPTILFTNPSQPSSGQNTSIYLSLKNYKDIEAGPFDVHFFDEYISPEGYTIRYPVGEKHIEGLGPLALTTITIEWNPQDRIGSHTIIVEADFRDAIEEVNEQNNRISEPIEVVTPYPMARITSPATGQAFLTDDLLNLHAFGYDYQDGDLSAPSLVWTSSIDGFLGIGEAPGEVVLSTGEHVITLQATDGDGNAVEDQISITVTPSAIPIVSIEIPSEEQLFPQGETVYLQGTADDPEDGTLPEESITWISSIDGIISTGSSRIIPDLSVGDHIITLEAMDSTGVKGSARVNITIEYGIPLTLISSPSEGEEFFFHQQVDLSGSAIDTQDGILSGNSIKWQSDLDGFLGIGASLNRSNLTTGYHTLTLTATDSHGLTDADEVKIRIHPPYPPASSILSPAEGAAFSYGEVLPFEGRVSDPEDGMLSGSSLIWSSDINGSLGTGTSFGRSNLSVGVHRITLGATDSMGLSTSASVSITVNPAALINEPADGAIYSQENSILLKGDVLGLADGIFKWRSSIDGLLGSGKQLTVSNLSSGTHTITLTTENADGLQGNASVNIIVTGKSTVLVNALSDGFSQKNLTFIAFSNKTMNELNSLSDGSTGKYLEFNGSEDKIVYLKVPADARVEYASLELTGANKNHGTFDFTEDFTTSTYRDAATNANWESGTLVAKLDRINKDVITNWEFNNNMESWTGDYHGAGNVVDGGKQPDASNTAEWGWKYSKFYTGSWSRIYQPNVDLSDVEKIEFKYLWGGDYWNSCLNKNMGFRVDGNRLWSYTPHGDWPTNDARRLHYGDIVTVDVSSYTGTHTLSFRTDIEGCRNWYWYWYDGSSHWETSAVDDVKAYSEGYSESTAISKTINDPFGPIVKIKLAANDDTTGGDIRYYISADGGNHWEAVPKDVLYSLSYPGNAIRWKAELTPTSEDATPSINSVRIIVSELYPANPWLDVSGDGDNEWRYNGVFGNTETTSDFSAEVSQHLFSHPADTDGNVLVPLLVHSDSDGIINLSKVNVTYETGEERPPQNQTIYLKIPKAADLTLATLDLGDPTGHAKNATLDVGADGNLEWNFTGTLEELKRTPDLSAEIEKYIATCTMDSEGNCLVPLVLGSDTSGNIKITNINIQYLVLDIVPPIIGSLSAAPNPARPGDMLNIQANVTDNIKVESVTANLSGITAPLAYNEETAFYEGTVSASQSGNYTITVSAIDPAGLISNKSMRVLVKSVKPDLIVIPEGITHSPVESREGDAVTVNAIIQNMGDVNADNFYVKLMVDGVSQSSKLVSIQAGSYATIQFEWNAIYSDHEVTVVADSTGIVPEDDETNNMATIPLFIADATPPTIDTITVEPEPAYTGDVLALKAKVSDNVGIDEIKAVIYGKAQFLVYNNATGLYEGIITSSKAGTYPVALLATDKSGLVSSAQIEITINPLESDLTLTAADISFNPSTVADGDTATVNAKIHNTGKKDANNFKAELLIDGISQGTNDMSVTGGNSSVVQFTWKAVYGRHEFTIRADKGNSVTEKDENNNIANKTAFISDRDPPVIHEITFTPAVVREGAPLVIHADVVDNVKMHRVNATLDEIEVSLSYNPDSGLYEGATTAPVAGGYLVDVRAADITGLTSLRQTPVEIRRNEPDLEVSATGVVISPLRAVENDAVTVNATIRNKGGSYAGNFDVIYSVDGTVEDVANISLAAGKTEILRFDWNAVYGEHTLTITIDPDNRILEIDESNNANSKTLFVSDVISPEVTGLESVPAGWTTNTVHDLSWKPSYDKNGIDRYEYLIDYGKWTNIGSATNISTPALSDGVHTIYVRAVDRPGNVGTPSNVTIYIDTTPPNSPIIKEWHTGKDWSQHDSPYISWNNPGDRGSGVTHYLLSMDNKTPIDIGNNLSYHPTVETGIHTFKVYAVDTLEQTSNWSNEITVYIDTIKPFPPEVTSPTHPENLWYPVNTPIFNLTAPSDHSGINGYYYLVDVFNSTTPDSLSRWTTNNKVEVRERGGIWPLNQIPPVGLPDGIWYFHVVPRDNSKNVGTNATHYKVMIDAHPPFISNMMPSEGKVIRTGRPLINATLIDGFSGVNVSTVVVILDGEIVNASVTSDNVYYIPPQCLVDGNYTATIEASDLAGNNATVSRNFTVLLPRVDAGVVEEVEAAYNAEGNLVKSEVAGSIMVVNKENFTIPSADLVVENISSTSLENQTIYAFDISEGENSVATYTVHKTPRLNMSLEWTTSLENMIRFNWTEYMDFRVMVGNPSSDELGMVNITFPLPDGISNIEVLNVTSLTAGFEYNAASESFRWGGNISPNEVKELAFRLTVRASDEMFLYNNTLNLKLNASATYEVGETLSGLTIGNVCHCVVFEDTFHLTRSSIQLEETIPILVVSKNVLAWTTDEANDEFINELDEFMSGVLIKNVTSKEEFFSEFRTDFYNVLLMANTNWPEELDESEVEEIEEFIYGGGPVGRTLIMSGFALKYVPELDDVLGGEYKGSLPMGKRFRIKQVTVTENHSITEGYVGQSLNSTSWAVKVETEEGGSSLAYFEDVWGDEEKDKHSHHKEFPAITVSSYGQGTGVLFSSDIGTSIREGLNREEWLEMVSRAIEWIPPTPAASLAIEIEKELHPEVIVAKVSASEESRDKKHANVKVTIENIGQSDLFNVSVTEILPEEIVLANGTLSLTTDKLEVADEMRFDYSLWVPVSGGASYNLLTEVTAMDGSGNLHYFNKSLTLEASLPPRHDKDDDSSSLSLNKSVKRIKNESSAEVTITLKTSGKSPVKAASLQEYIPKELNGRGTNGTFADFGLTWNVEAVEQKKTVSYMLDLPEVSKPTSYELKSVVEYQNLEESEVLEDTYYLVVDSSRNVKLKKKEHMAKEKGDSKIEEETGKGNKKE